MTEAKEKTKKKKTTSKGKTAQRKTTSAPKKTSSAPKKAAPKKATGRAKKVVKIIPEDKNVIEKVSVKKKTKKVEAPKKVEKVEKVVEKPKKPAEKRIIEDIRPEPIKKVEEKKVETPKVVEKPAEKPEKVVEKKPKKRAEKRKPHAGLKRFLLVIAFAAAAVFAIVYFVNLNTPNVELRLASIQTGIDGNVYPNYVPRDYGLSSFTAETGKIVLYFENHGTGEAFSLSAENSSWDSNSLYANFVKGNYSENYAAIKEQGLTLYVDSNKACWVNGGVLYKINVTSGSLTKKQIKAIAVSL